MPVRCLSCCSTYWQQEVSLVWQSSFHLDEISVWSNFNITWNKMCNKLMLCKNSEPSCEALIITACSFNSYLLLYNCIRIVMPFPIVMQDFLLQTTSLCANNQHFKRAKSQEALCFPTVCNYRLISSIHFLYSLNLFRQPWKSLSPHTEGSPIYLLNCWRH